MKRKYNDPRGQHVRLYCDLLDSPAWKALSYSQQALYVAARCRLNSNNNGNIAITRAWLLERGIDMSSSTLAAGLRALLAVGLIAVSREGGNVRRGQAIPTLYRFTDEDCHDWPKLFISATRATNDWRRFTAIAQAKAAINVQIALDRQNASLPDAHLDTECSAKQSSCVLLARKKKTPTRFSNRDASNFEHGTLRNSKAKAISGFENRVVDRNVELAASLVH